MLKHRQNIETHDKKTTTKNPSLLSEKPLITQPTWLTADLLSVIFTELFKIQPAGQCLIEIILSVEEVGLEFPFCGMKSCLIKSYFVFLV